MDAIAKEEFDALSLRRDVVEIFKFVFQATLREGLKSTVRINDDLGTRSHGRGLYIRLSPDHASTPGGHKRVALIGQRVQNRAPSPKEKIYLK